MTTRKTFLLGLILGSFLATVAVGQQQGGQPPQPRNPPDRRDQQNVPNPPNPANMPKPPNPDPLHDVMFPPDLVLSRARQLNLTDDQKAFIRGEVQKTTTTFNDLKWKLQDEMEVLRDTLKSTSVNEQQALAQLNKVLDLERQVKMLHIGLGVRIKNRLTPDQQEQLQRVSREPPRMPPPGGQNRPPDQQD